ncbi:thiolase-like protein [Cercophora newfieldiana]|uniref:Thiolase-like protein n=1 Tax=Cercophora newfieldiana TaxID=92897 RepID=A0AA39Y8Z9_9PEZI|nr:thiolase-like protein [Cercophora newfieldiana]
MATPVGDQVSSLPGVTLTVSPLRSEIPVGAPDRISYIFNLQGPSLTIDTACSSSMYALHLAVNAIRAGDCDSAIVASANWIADPGVQIALDKLEGEQTPRDTTTTDMDPVSVPSSNEEQLLGDQLASTSATPTRKRKAPDSPGSGRSKRTTAGKRRAELYDYVFWLFLRTLRVPAVFRPCRTVLDVAGAAPLSSTLRGATQPALRAAQSSL